MSRLIYSAGFSGAGIIPIREQTHPQIRLPKGVTKVLNSVNTDGDSSRMLELTFGAMNDSQHA